MNNILLNVSCRTKSKSSGILLGSGLCAIPYKVLILKASSNQFRIQIIQVVRSRPQDICKMIPDLRYKEMLLKMQEKAAVPWNKIFNKAWARMVYRNAR